MYVMAAHLSLTNTMHCSSSVSSVSSSSSGNCAVLGLERAVAARPAALLLHCSSNNSTGTAVLVLTPQGRKAHSRYRSATRHCHYTTSLP